MFGQGQPAPAFTSTFGQPQQQQQQPTTGLFGQPQPSSTLPAYGQTTSTLPTFGQQQPSTLPGYGQTTSTLPTFGQQPPAALTTFGQQPSTALTTFGQQPSAGSTTFGQQPSTGSTTFGQQPSAGSTTFGQQPSAAAPTFGQLSSTFGQPPAAAAATFGQPLTFGQATTAPTFGTLPSSTTTFGQPSSTTTFGQLQQQPVATTTGLFDQTPATATTIAPTSFLAPNFGQSQPGAAAAPVNTFSGGGISTGSIGSTQQQQQTPSFAPQPASASLGGFTFGAGTGMGTAAPVVASTTQSGLGLTQPFNFSQPKTQEPVTGVQGMGTPAPAAIVAPLGSTTTTPFKLPFSSTPGTPGLNLTSAANTITGISSIPSTQPPAATTTTLFTGFGATTNTIAPQSLPTSTTIASVQPLGATTTSGGQTTTVGAAIGAPPTTSTIATFTTATTGLGGIQTKNNDPSQVLSAGTVEGGMSSEQRTLKESPLPTELIELVEELKNRMTTEKDKLAALSKEPDNSIDTVADGCEGVRLQITNLSNLIHRQMLNCDSLKVLVEKDHKDAEMAQITRDTPPAFQHENQLPSNYLFKLLQHYQDKMIVYKKEILKADVALRSLESSTPLTPADLSIALKASKDLLILLAAKVKCLHERVTNEADAHRNMLKFVQGDMTRDVFTEKGRQTRQTGPPMMSRDKSGAAKSSILFPSEFRPPSNKGFSDYMGGSPTANATQRVLHSTQALNTSMGKQFDNTTFNIPAYGNSLFNTQASPIFPSQMTSPTAGGTSLKRSKH